MSWSWCMPLMRHQPLSTSILADINQIWESNHVCASKEERDAAMWRPEDFQDSKVRLLLPLLGGVVTTREHTSPLSTNPTCEDRQAQLLQCPANCGCKNSLSRLAEKSRVVKDYGLRSENAELISNTCIAGGEIVAIFGQTATIWSQDEVREFDRVAVKQNAIERDVQKFEFYVNGSNPENQCHLHVVPCEDAELALSMEITSSLRH